MRFVLNIEEDGREGRRRKKKERKRRSSGDIIATRTSTKIPIAISRLQNSMPNIVMIFLSRDMEC